MSRNTLLVGLLLGFGLAHPIAGEAQATPDAFLDYINDRSGGFDHFRMGIFLGLWTNRGAHNDFVKSLFDVADRVTNPLSGLPFGQDVIVVSAGLENQLLDLGRVALNHLEFPTTEFRVTRGTERVEQTKMAFDILICHSNGCVLALAAIERGDIRAKQVVALGTDWLGRSFDPGSLGGAEVTFFRRSLDLIPRIAAPRWTRAAPNTPGLAFTVRPGGDGFSVIDLDEPKAAGTSDRGLFARHSLSGYFEAVSELRQAGRLPASLNGSAPIVHAGAGSTSSSVARSSPVASIPARWSTEGPDSPSGTVAQEARMLADLGGADITRAVVFGGPAASELHSEMVKRIGAQNVLRVAGVPEAFEQQRIARGFQADAILGVRTLQDRLPPRASSVCGDSGTLCPPPDGPRFTAPPPRPPGPPPGSITSPLRSATPARHLNSADFRSGVGGVWLATTASVSGDVAALTGGDFSLIFDDPESGMDLQTLRRFVTALWAVYFSETGPGISIDPTPVDSIHLVRYIGQVINLDIGRVMREADYQMKRWAVGVDSPEIAGFRSVDQLQAKYGIRALNASRRFWFVPDNMRFQLMGNALIFESGRMKLNTEYVFLDTAGGPEPADTAFANFFTDHYDEIAAKYRVFAELFEYAKLVSLARYLKDEGVPLLWFLLANKDLVITEDSPGTVEAFAKRSEFRQELEIRGGVDLAQPLSESNYVVDQAAAQAFRRAIRESSTEAASLSAGITSFTPAQITVSHGDRPLEVRTAHSLALSSGGGGGSRYYTDVALRVDGAPGLELVRYYDPDRPTSDFGPGWHLGLPYAVQPSGDSTVSFLNAVIPSQMAIDNPMTGREEVLTFSTEQYAIDGYVPDALEESNLVGLFWLTDQSVRLADKVGSEFQFDPSGRLTQMILTDRHVTDFEYGLEVVTAQSLGSQRYWIESRGSELVEVLNVRLPQELEIHDQREGTFAVFAYDDDNEFDVIGYSPVESDSPYTVLALMTDGSFTLGGDDGSEISFDRAWRFEELSRSVVTSVTNGDHQVRFEREYAGGAFRIRRAHISSVDGEVVDTINYEYGSDGRLSRVWTARGSEVDIVYDGSRVASVTR